MWFRQNTETLEIVGELAYLYQIAIAPTTPDGKGHDRSYAGELLNYTIIFTLRPPRSYYMILILELLLLVDICNDV